MYIYTFTSTILFYLILYSIFLYITQKYFNTGYYKYIPKIPLFPNELDEIKIIKKYIKKRSNKDIQFWQKTEISPAVIFLPYIKENLYELNKISIPIILTTGFCKYLFNRPRPFNVDLSLNHLDKKHAESPSFPSGHTSQAYYLAKVLSKRYPDKKNLFFNLANQCACNRIIAGLHYPSDCIFGKYLAFNLYSL